MGPHLSSCAHLDLSVVNAIPDSAETFINHRNTVHPTAKLHGFALGVPGGYGEPVSPTRASAHVEALEDTFGIGGNRRDAVRQTVKLYGCSLRCPSRCGPSAARPRGSSATSVHINVIKGTHRDRG